MENVLQYRAFVDTLEFEFTMDVLDKVNKVERRKLRMNNSYVI